MCIRDRTFSDWKVDDGAQYFTAQDPTFQAQTTRWLQQGVIGLWQPRLCVIEGDPVCLRVKAPTLHKRYVGVPSMAALPAFLATEHAVQLNSSIDQLRRSQLGWQVHSLANGWSENHAQALVLALPPAQSLALLQNTPSTLTSKLATFSMRPAWALMLRMPQEFDPGFDAAFVNVGPLRWIAKDSSKPGREPQNIWLVHASAKWSELNIERSVSEIGELLSEEFKTLTGGEPLEAALHLWRYADTEAPADNGCFWDEGLALGVCGDWLGEGKVEGAWKSGKQLADKICRLVASAPLHIEFAEIEFASPAYEDALALRQAVLREPLGRMLDRDDLDGEDKQIHFACFDKRGKVVACISAKVLGEKTCKLRQMAVHEAYRGRGVGAMLLRRVEAAFKAKGFEWSELHARESAQVFYKKSAYEQVGNLFEEVGIAHLKMIKRLSEE